MSNMGRDLDVIVERIIHKNRGKSKNTLQEGDFIDLLNFGLKNPGTVNLVYLNTRSNRKYRHEIEFREEYRTYKFLSYTFKKITNCMDDLKLPLR